MVLNLRLLPDDGMVVAKHVRVKWLLYQMSLSAYLVVE